MSTLTDSCLVSKSELQYQTIGWIYVCSCDPAQFYYGIVVTRAPKSFLPLCVRTLFLPARNFFMCVCMWFTSVVGALPHSDLVETFLLHSLSKCE